jgi:hypothetical protein
MFLVRVQQAFYTFVDDCGVRNAFLVCDLSKTETAFMAYVRKYGKVTVPKGVRDALGIEAGALVECKIRRVKQRKKKGKYPLSYRL